MALSVDTTPAKHVTVLRNGDNKYEGRRFIVSRRRYRTFDSLLSDITNQISAPFGAVRRLYTPKGRRQIRGIDDLEGGATYVAGGSERFKKLDYSPLRLPGKNWSTLASGRPGFLADEPPPLVLPRKNRRYAQRSAQFYKVQQPVQFTVYRNGVPSDKGARFLLKDKEMKNFETVLSIISLKIRLVEGAVRRLYTPEGGSLIGPDEIVDGGFYVACGHRRFLPGPYGEVAVASRSVLQKLPAIKRSKEGNHVSPRTQSNPLPAIQRKAMQQKARSEKDSPAPIEEGKEASLPLDNHVNKANISKTEIKTAKRASKNNLKNNNSSIQAVSSEEVKKVPSKSGLDRNPPSKNSNNASPQAPSSPANANVSANSLNASAPDEASVFNATSEKPGQEDGKFLMNAVEDTATAQQVADEVDEDKDLVEDTPIELQQAEEVEEEDIRKPNA